MTGTYTNGAGQVTTKTVSFTISNPKLISGTVTLSGYNGGLVPMTLQVRNLNSSTVVQEYTINVKNGSAFSVSTNLTGTYDVTLKGSHWLRQKLTGVTFGPSGAAGLNFSLLNGDINNDNVVGPTDLLQVRAAYGSTPGSSNWNPNADLNGDGAVGPSDLLIVRANYGKSGQ